MNRRRLFTALSVCLLFFSIAHAQQKRPMTIEDVLAMKNVGGAQISPDGKMVLYSLSYADLKENKSRTELWMVRTGGGEPFRFTSGERDTAQSWSPDGQTIAFLSARDGGSSAEGSPGRPNPQIHLISPFGGEARKLTNSKTGVSAYSWSPDSKKIAYVAQVPLTEAEEKKQKEKDDPQVADEQFRYSHLWVIDVESGKAAEIVKENLVLSDPQWSPDGTRLSFTAHPTPKADDGSLSDIYIANADGSGRPKKLFENNGPDSGARWSPDGKLIALSSRDAQHGLLGVQHLFVIPSGGGTPRAIAPNVDNPSNVTWAQDGSAIFLSALDGTSTAIYRAPLDGETAIPLWSDDGVISGFSLSGDNERVAFSLSDLQHPADIFVSPFPKFSAKRLTNHNPVIETLALGRSQVSHWKSKDGREIEGIVIFPAGYEQGKRYPTLALIHGGPSGVWTQSFPASWGNYAHVWAGKGWVVFLPNVRGSAGYGEEFLLSNVGDWGGGDYQDIQSGLDELIKQGVADPEKLGQSGWSYGGYMTAWTLTQTSRFKAVMVGAGLTDMFSMYSTNDLQRILEGYFGGTPFDDPKAYEQASAMTFIKQAKTPALIMHGGSDNRVPPDQAKELYMGLRKNNVPVQMVIYPREGHPILEPRHQLDKMKRETAWFSKHVLGIEGAEEKEKAPGGSEEKK